MNQNIDFGFSENTDVDKVRKHLSTLYGVKKVYLVTCTSIRVYYNETQIAAKVLAKAARGFATDKSRNRSNIVNISQTTDNAA